jgi:hypothetical protein
MQKVLPGASRAALGFIAANWQGLAKMSVIPAIAYVLLFYVQLSSMSDLYRAMGSMINGQNINPAFFSAYSKAMGLNFLFSIIGGALMTSLFVQIIRFQKFGQSQWLLSDVPGWKATGMVFVYALGIVMLTLAAYLALIFVVIIISVIFSVIAALIAGKDAAGVITALVMVLSFVVFVAGLLWFMFRFFAGLPGVALGHSPDFFKDLWPLTKGESWGLPLRVLLATILLYIPLALVMWVAVWPGIQELINNPAFQPGNDDPAVMFPFLADMMDRMKPYGILLILIYMPFVWFISLLLGEAFQRFRERQGSRV